MPDIHVHTAGVLVRLNNLNPLKAQGPDSLHPYLLKRISNEIAPMLTIIVNRPLQTDDVPDDWRQENIAPVFK